MSRVLALAREKQSKSDKRPWESVREAAPLRATATSSTPLTPLGPAQGRLPTSHGASNSPKWDSGQVQLDAALAAGKWPDGAPIGRGFGQPYLQHEYAKLMAAGCKTAEGRPGGGWLVGKKGGSIAVNDYVSFKICGHVGRKLTVCVAPSLPRAGGVSALSAEVE